VPFINIVEGDQQMKKKAKWILGGLVVVLAVAYGAMTALRPLEVDTLTVVKEDLVSTLNVQGELIPATEIVLMSPFAGTVLSCATEGRELSAGEVAAELDAVLTSRAADLQGEQIRQQLTIARQNYERLYGTGGVAQAGVETATSALAKAQADFANGEELLAAGALAQSDLAVLEQALTAAEQALTIAQADASEQARAHQQNLIRSYETQIALVRNGRPDGTPESVTIAAPTDCVVLRQDAPPGTPVAAGQALLHLYDPQALKLSVSLLATDAVRYNLGDKVSALLADGSSVEAEIDFISPVAEESVSALGLTERRSLVELRLPGLPARIGAGQPAELTFRTLLAADALTVPLAALVVAGEHGEGVYLLREGRAVFVPVTTGMRAGGRVQVVEGLNVGDVVVVNPYEDKVSAGARVVTLGD
jgi:multidrug efflux pump subunit AcrA (membrane-fusion protein)